MGNLSLLELVAREYAQMYTSVRALRGRRIEMTTAICESSTDEHPSPSGEGCSLPRTPWGSDSSESSSPCSRNNTTEHGADCPSDRHKFCQVMAASRSIYVGLPDVRF